MHTEGLADHGPRLLARKCNAGSGDPYTFHEPATENYADLFGGLFSKTALIALAFILLALLPLILAWLVNRYLDRKGNRSISSGPIWLAGLFGTLALGWLVNIDQYQMLLDTGDFIMVNVRTILYVVVCIPLFFVVGLTLAIILNNTHLGG